jgi:hypothetical protein
MMSKDKHLRELRGIRRDGLYFGLCVVIALTVAVELLDKFGWGLETWELAGSVDAPLWARVATLVLFVALVAVHRRRAMRDIQKYAEELGLEKE